MSFIVYALGAVGLAVIGQLCLKLGLSAFPAEATAMAIFQNVALQLFRSPLLWGGLVCYGGSTLLWMMALSTTQLNRLYPFTALTFALVMIFSHLILRESMSVPALIGVGIILAGLYLVVRG